MRTKHYVLIGYAQTNVNYFLLKYCRKHNHNSLMVGSTGDPNWRLFDKQQYLTDTVITYYKLMSTLEKGKRGTGRTLDKLHHSMNFRILFLYFFTVESALDLKNVEGKSFKSGLALVGRWFQWLSASNICNEKRITLIEERAPYK